MDKADYNKLVSDLTTLCVNVQKVAPTPETTQIITETVDEYGPEKVMSLFLSFLEAPDETTYEGKEFMEFLERLHDKQINRICWRLFVDGKIEATVDPKTNEWVFWKKPETVT